MPSETPYNSVIAAPAPRRTQHAAQHPAAARRPAQRLGALAAPALKPHTKASTSAKKALKRGRITVPNRASHRVRITKTCYTPLHRLCPKLRSRAAAECASRPRGAARARGAARMTPPARPPTRRGPRTRQGPHAQAHDRRRPRSSRPVLLLSGSRWRRRRDAPLGTAPVARMKYFDTYIKTRR